MKRLFVLIVLFILAPVTVTAQEAKREITRITDDVYRFQNNFHVNMFVITDAGVVVTDPINAEAAGWLKEEIAKLTDQPITHLIYSHSHGDHASGGDWYGEVENIIAQQNAPDEIDDVTPTIRFDYSHNFSLGGKRFELTYLGPGHGNDLIAMVVRPDNVAFVVDAVSSKRLFYRDFNGANVDHWIEQVERINALNFETLIGGHGPVGVKADVANGLAYLQQMRAEVLAGLRSGKSVAELEKSVTMDKYRDWAAYAQWRKLNVQGMARYLQESGAAN
ncbi:MAG: glyoxylase-like metal-dependent hydrolase (beta-lactamase superfamily II) [Planctomycetota bacterium]|jgi:glyoxylase-like metal-dependent hydrolase (beta-lactamase superfamily II)